VAAAVAVGRKEQRGKPTAKAARGEQELTAKDAKKEKRS